MHLLGLVESLQHLPEEVINDHIKKKEPKKLPETMGDVLVGVLGGVLGVLGVWDVLGVLGGESSARSCALFTVIVFTSGDIAPLFNNFTLEGSFW